MAIMCPPIPREFSPASREGEIFRILSGLPDTYYVFHSFSIVTVVDGVLHESEADFVVFHPQKGVLCIEAKAGQVDYRNGQWVYGNGIPMAHDGPFHQAARSKYKLIDYFKKCDAEDILRRCKFLHAVWFPSITKDKFIGKSLPSEATLTLMLTKDSEDNIEKAISEIFALNVPSGVETVLGAVDIDIILNRILAPSFNLVSLAEVELNHKRSVFKSMLKEQVALLNYLEEQNTAVINGMAGTGKTVMAIEKAKRHAYHGENVLFLCYNKLLRDHLANTYHHDNIGFYTIDGLACKLCATPEPDYARLQEVLLEMYVDGSFPYQHIIIDEGQDFGKESMEECKIIDLLKSIAIEDESRNGSFYLFYDKNQMIQTEKAPDYIDDADCKLTLYRNCRNTENIATTSLRLLGSEKKPKLYDGALTGDSPDMYLLQSAEETVVALEKALDKAIDAEYDQIQILTCSTENKSRLASEMVDGHYPYRGKKIPFTTCRKFKGLEADVIILVDIDKDDLLKGGDQILYVGSSRARYHLDLLVNLTNPECDDVINTLGLRKSKNPGKVLATSLNAKFKKHLD